MTTGTFSRLLFAAGVFCTTSVQAQRGGPGMGGGGPMQEERKLVPQFDKDKNGWLNSTERRAARDYLATQPQQGPGARGGPPNGGGFGGPPNGGPPNGPPNGGGFAGGPPGGMGGRGRGGPGGPVEPASPGAKISPADVKPSAAPLYDLGTLRTLFLTFENNDWEEEMAAFNNTDVDVPATLIVDGKSYADVGVHFRGASSFFGVPAGSKRSLNIAVDFINNEQNVMGYRTLNLLNSHEDPTLMHAVLYEQIAREYIPAPKSNFVRVVINGENWGVYTNAQQFNKDFLRDNFKTTAGARWKVPGSPQGRGGLEYLGEDPAPYKRIYEIKTADNKKSWNDLINFTRVLNETPADQLEAKLGPILDIDGALKFLALEIALVNGDGYWVRSSDYSIFEDSTGKFHIIPHDANETFSAGGGGPMGGGGRGGPGGFAMGRGGNAGGPPDGPPNGPPNGQPGGGRGRGPGGGGVNLDPLTGANDQSKALLSKLLAVPALRARYVGYVRDIAERWMDWKNLEPLVRRNAALIDKEVERDTKKLTSYAEFKSSTSADANDTQSLRSFVEKRRAFLLAHPALAR